ncbi:MAG: hypothetical protein KAS32_20595 [Candidatus Peribacteraceae bacterium]|nr:hypothetical protein [Candidatus Peribacteraceae bacterium]
MKKLQVICFYWEGDRWRSDIASSVSSDPQYRRLLQRTGPVQLDLAAKYVNNLFAGVTRFASEEFDFICFTNEKLDVNPGIEIRPFSMMTKRGVLPRLYMFSKESGLWGHQVLCLDLDVVVVGDMKELMQYRGIFCARAKFKFGEEFKLDGDIMSFKAGPDNTARFWKPFVLDIDGALVLTQGRERYWVRHVANDIADKWQTIAPRTVLSLKRHMSGVRVVPAKASIISCHGYPRPHQVDAAWIKEYWNE